MLTLSMSERHLGGKCTHVENSMSERHLVGMTPDGAKRNVVSIPTVGYCHLN